MPDDNDGPPRPFDRLHMLLRVAATIIAGIPSTIVVPLALTQALTPRFQRETLLKRLHFMVPWARFCVAKTCQAELKIRGIEHLPQPSRGHLYISNHQSYVDILVLMAALDTVAFLSKGLVRRLPIIGRCAYCGGTVFFERGSKEERARALEETLRMCHQSTAVLVFPEGTRSDNDQLRPKIYPRALHEAWRHGLRVLPVAVDGSGQVIPKSMDRIRLNQTVAVWIGPPRDPSDFNSPESFADACWGDVATLFDGAKDSRKHLRS